MKALILVDIQNDFLPTGALPVPKGDEVVSVANEIMGDYPIVVATQDWHPANHGSFAASHPGKNPFAMIDLNGLPQVLWPVHCVQGSFGAEMAPGLNVAGITKVFQKGTDLGIDSYSGFFDNGRRKATGLGEWLKAQGVDVVDIMGLATDYCVKATALDAVSLRFRTSLMLRGCRGVELAVGDCEKAVEAMKAAGVKVQGEGQR
jgi:nicotinamidase/pyrazinamidase